MEMEATVRAHLRRTTYTEAEYLAMEGASPVKHEYIDGEIYDMAGGDEDHALVGMNVGATLRSLIKGGKGRCRAYSSDLRIWSPLVRSYVYPDASVVCGPSVVSDRKGDRASLQNPVVVVEVISPGSEDYDRTDKVAIYKAIPTVRDYLIIDIDERRIEHHVRDDDGSWRLVVVTEGEVPLAGIPVALPLAEVFADLDAR
jgi:Uma2 family endonuclease